MPSCIISDKVRTDMQEAAWIKEMFERGALLKATLGAHAVADLSLGNPNAAPPEAFFQAMALEASRPQPELHRYMPNGGFPASRAAVASFLSAEYRMPFQGEDVILTSGAAGAMTLALRAMCNPGDEVIVLAPYFAEYRFYVEHAGATLVVVDTDAVFQPDLEALEAALTPRTRAVLVNSPNNPTGAVYSEAMCRALAELLARHDSPSRPLYLILDDPYRRILYDAPFCPTSAPFYSRVMIASSYSKDLSIPGERLGYLAVPRHVLDRDLILGAMAMLNRTLGFVNASAFMQRVIVHCADALCDLELYRRNREQLCQALLETGYQLEVPAGALYAFPRTPIQDDAKYADLLAQRGVLVVPGRGFGRRGHIRLSFCVDPETVARAVPVLREVFLEVTRG